MLSPQLPESGILIHTSSHSQVTTRLIFSSSPVPCWVAAILTTPAEDDLVPVKPEVATSSSSSTGDNKPEVDAKEGAKERAKEARKTWFRVERARNLGTRHSTILLQEKSTNDYGNWAKVYFLGYTLIGTVLFSTGYPWT